ncbi:MAG: cysteine synthase family protein [Myxococcota bacterium]|nr:cysteine synthase family protein [Myxococcota bacterium]
MKDQSPESLVKAMAFQYARPQDSTGGEKSMVATILDQIGNTPLVALSKPGVPEHATIYGKCEFLNPGGSVKDRIALAMLDAAERDGQLTSGGTVIEATAGNTGIGLALVCAQRQYKLVCVMPEKMSEDKRQALRALGAEVIVTDNAPPGDPKNFKMVAARLAQERPNHIWTDQFSNAANAKVHETTTGPEIWRQTNGCVGAFVAGVGTGGTITGVGRYLKAQNPDVRIVLADPKGSRLAGLINEGALGDDGPYLVEGIGSSEVSDIFDTTVVDEAITIDDRTSFLVSAELIRDYGLLVGPSSGTTVATARHLAARGDVVGHIVALLPDGWDRYWSKTLDADWMTQLNLPPMG